MSDTDKTPIPVPPLPPNCERFSNSNATRKFMVWQVHSHETPLYIPLDDPKWPVSHEFRQLIARDAEGAWREESEKIDRNSVIRDGDDVTPAECFWVALDAAIAWREWGKQKT